MRGAMPKPTQDDQSEVIEFISKLGSDVELVITHASIIFLAGDRAFKLKRAVRYPYLDFSSGSVSPAVRPSLSSIIGQHQVSISASIPSPAVAIAASALMDRGNWWTPSSRCAGSAKTTSSILWPGKAH
jgi:hypothetical protein